MEIIELYAQPNESIGIAVVQQGDTLIVKSVKKGSRGESSGCRSGDEVVSAHDIEVKDMVSFMSVVNGVRPCRIVLSRRESTVAAAAEVPQLPTDGHHLAVPMNDALRRPPALTCAPRCLTDNHTNYYVPKGVKRARRRRKWLCSLVGTAVVSRPARTLAPSSSTHHWWQGSTAPTTASSKNSSCKAPFKA